MESNGHTSSRRVGILGGTFDPIHFGHLHLAREAKARFSLDVVLLMPTDDPYYKTKSQVSSFDDRLFMVKLAVQSEDGLIASDFERVHDTDGYTINTLKAYKKFWPDDELFFIIGGDTLFSIDKWKDIDQIFSMTHILVNKRKDEAKGASGSLSLAANDNADISKKMLPGKAAFPATMLPDKTASSEKTLQSHNTENDSEVPDEELEQQIALLTEKYHASIFNLHAEQFDISSSELRAKIRRKESVSSYLPEAVISYISENNLYQ